MAALWRDILEPDPEPLAWHDIPDWHAQEDVNQTLYYNRMAFYEWQRYVDTSGNFWHWCPADDGDVWDWEADLKFHLCTWCWRVWAHHKADETYWFYTDSSYHKEGQLPNLKVSPPFTVRGPRFGRANPHDLD